MFVKHSKGKIAASSAEQSSQQSPQRKTATRFHSWVKQANHFVCKQCGAKNTVGASSDIECPGN